MDFLPTAGREYNTKTGGHFTVRSANSVSYSLTCRPLRNTLYQREEEEAKRQDRCGTQTDTSEKNKAESSFHYQSRTWSGVKDQSLEREKWSIRKNQSTAEDKSTEFVTDQMRNSERQGRTEWRKSNLSTRSKSLDWRTGAKSPERRPSYRDDIRTSRTEDIRGAEREGSRVMSTVQTYNAASNDQGKTLTRGSRGQSLPSRLRSQFAPLGPKGGQSISERIEKLYGSSEFGNNDDYHKKTEQQSFYKGSFGDTFPRCFSSGETRLNSGQVSGESLSWTFFDKASVSITPGISRSPSGQWQKETMQVDVGNVFRSRRLSDIGTRSLDRARSRSTVAEKIRAARSAEEKNKPTQSNTDQEGISEVCLGAGERGTNKVEENHRDLKKWCRTSVKERTEHANDQAHEKDVHRQLWMKKESSSDDVFDKSIEKKTFDDKPSLSAASVRNKIYQFEALTQRAQATTHRRAFSVPEHLTTAYDGVQRSSSAKAIGTVKYRWEGLKEEKVEGRGVTGIKTFGLERFEKLDQDKTSKKEIDLRSVSVDEARLNKVWGDTEKEQQYNKYSEVFDEYSKIKTTLKPPLNKDSHLITSDDFHINETDFSQVRSPVEVRNKDTSSSSPLPYSDASPGEKKSNCSGYATLVSNNEKPPTNTTDNSPFPSINSHPQKTTSSTHKKNENNSDINKGAKTPVSYSLDMSPPIINNLPDLVSKNNVNGKKWVLDLNAWLDGLNPQIKAWGDDEDDDDESTQKGGDSNYDSDSGESSVTITSNMSNKSFSISLADLCNFAGVEYDSENDSDELQPAGRRSVSLSSDVSAFSYVSVLPSEELDKLIEDVRSIGDNSLQDYEDVHVVVLHKDIGVGLGFSLAGGVDQNKPVTVHKVFYSGVAAQEGSIREGDRVLSINGTALSGFAHWEALRVLRRAKGREMGVVVLKKPDISRLSNRYALTVNQGPTPTQVTEISQCISVNLEKNNRDLGFSLEGGVGSSLGNKPLTVQKIFQGGPVDKIIPGDELLEINGVSMVAMRRLEAWTLIRQLPAGSVNVVLRRPQPHKT